MNKCPNCNKEIEEELIQSNKDVNKYICFNCKQIELHDQFYEIIKKRQKEYKDLVQRYIILNQGGNK